MIIRDETNVSVRFANDLNSAARYIQETPQSWSLSSSVNSSAKSSWDLNAGWSGALKLADSGWSEGAVDFSHRLGALPPNEAEPEYSYDVAGYMPDVPLYCAGDPMHMMNDGHPHGRKPIVHLVINTWILAMISAQEFKHYGVAMINLIQQIEATGRQVELDVVFCGRQIGRDILLGWKVKRAGEVTDLSAIAFSLAHPASFRRIGFALIERTPRSCQAPGYGYNAPLKREYADLINASEAFLLEGVGSSRGACMTQEGAIRFAANQINKAAGETIVEVRD